VNFNYAGLFRSQPFFAPDDPSSDPPADDEKDPPADKGLTQEAVNKLVGDARKQGGQTAVDKLLKTFGIKDETELKTLVETAKKAESEKLSETEKLNKTITELQQKASEQEKALAEKEAKISKRLMDSDIKMSASKAVMDKDGKTVKRAAFRADALDDLLLLIDRSKIEEKEGVFSGVDEALDALAKAKPWLLDVEEQKQGQGKGSPGTRKNKTGSQESGERTPIISSL
jgi:hypothetical protein